MVAKTNRKGKLKLETKSMKSSTLRSLSSSFTKTAQTRSTLYHMKTLRNLWSTWLNLRRAIYPWSTNGRKTSNRQKRGAMTFWACSPTSKERSKIWKTQSKKTRCAQRRFSARRTPSKCRLPKAAKIWWMRRPTGKSLPKYPRSEAFTTKNEWSRPIRRLTQSRKWLRSRPILIRCSNFCNWPKLQMPKTSKRSWAGSLQRPKYLKSKIRT